MTTRARANCGSPYDTVNDLLRPVPADPAPLLVAPCALSDSSVILVLAIFPGLAAPCA